MSKFKQASTNGAPPPVSFNSACWIFGGGTRTCIGMRFGGIETRTVATLLLQRFRLELMPGDKMTVRQMPTLGPRDGLYLVVRDRGVATAV